MAMRHERAALWRDRNYLLLWSGQALSTTGDAIQDVALPLLTLALTHSAAQVGIIVALEALPFPFLSLPAGVLIDRWNRKRVMLLCDIGRAIATGSLPLALWLGHLTIAQLYFVALVSGIFSTFFSLAETAALPNVVNKEQLSTAIGQNYATSIAAGIIGPPLGGLLYTLSSLLPFLANMISYGASVLSLCFMRVQFQQTRHAASQHFLREIHEGINWTWHHPLVRFLAIRVSAGNLVYGGSALILIVLATQQHAPAFAIGTIFTIDALGGIAASLLLERVQRYLSFSWIVIGLGWFTALLFPLYILASNFLILGLLSAALSFALVIFDVTQLGYRASIIPDEIFGRVTSSVRLFTVGAISFGAILTGVLIQMIGARATIIAFAVYLCVLALVTTSNKSVRSIKSLDKKNAEPGQIVSTR